MMINSDKFTAELAVAGLAGLPFSWTAEGVFSFDDAMSEAQRAQVLAVHAAHDPTLPAVLAELSPRQIRMALTRAGLRTAVESAVAAGDQDLKDWYEFSTAFERRNPQVLVMAAALNVSEAQLDDLWRLGITL